MKTTALAAGGAGVLRAASLSAQTLTPPFPGKFEPTWGSLLHYAAPDWFRDAKFGIFLHWGVYSVPAHANEWYPRLMYRRESPVFDWHRQHWGAQSMFGYKDFIPLFRAENWRPEECVELFKRAGAGYVVPVGEHCDGFPMYDSHLTGWCAAKMGPRRDIVGEWARAVRNQRLKLGVSTHRNWHWSWYTYESDFDTVNPLYSGLYGAPHAPTKPIDNAPHEILQIEPPAFLQDWYARTIEILNAYQPDLLWLEWGVQAPEYEPYRKELAAYYYNRAAEMGKQVVLTYKANAFPRGAAVMDVERGLLAAPAPVAWQSETSISWKSWGYIEDDRYKSANQILHEFIDVVSKNGNYLLNVGPKPDGTIPEPAVKVFRQMGAWMEVNGEGIFGSRPWKTFAEGPARYKGGSFGETQEIAFTPADIRFTRKGNSIYAFLMVWPGHEARITSLGLNAPDAPRNIARVTLLGSGQTLRWHQAADALRVELPAAKPCDYAYTLKITLHH
ncbi:MAG: alpha-L-fucosidase [Terriglobia bacterium]